MKSLVFYLLFNTPLAFGALPIEFKADFYQKDLQTNSLKGKGHAWIKTGPKEIWADEFEVDFTAKKAYARGHVHLKEGAIDVYCENAITSLDKSESILEKSTVTQGQVVLRGESIKQVNYNQFEIENGLFSSCNTELLSPPALDACSFDWKVEGASIKVTMEEYAKISHAVIYAKGIPIFYTPFLIAPVKTKRQSGFLFPQFLYSDNLGSGFKLPYFFALSEWQDFTLEPSYHLKTGFHFGGFYRYLYSQQSLGTFNFFLTERKFAEDRSNPGRLDAPASKFLNFFGEGAINFKNQIFFGDNSYSRQIIQLVSHPFYTLDYGNDLGVGIESTSLRSQTTFVHSFSPHALSANKIEYHQNLLISKDEGVDRGGVVQLPSLGLYSNFPKVGLNPIGFDINFQFQNFYRDKLGYDSISSTLNPAEGLHLDPNVAYHEGNYIRVGQRAFFEPRLFLQFPISRGFSFQPTTSLGLLGYHFDYPTSSFVSQYYTQIDLPISFYLSKTYLTSIKGFEKIQHIFQPTISYQSRPLLHQDSHPFFFKQNSQSLTNPRFDDRDFLIPFEYIRFELTNRLRRKTENGVERFFLFKVSENWNMKTFADDYRYAKKLSPLEAISEFGIWRITGQLQGNYSWEEVPNGNGNLVREMDFSASLNYSDPTGDRLSLGNRLRIRADDSVTEKTLLLSFYKSTPIFFDLEAALEYSYKRGEFLGTRMNFHFFSKPKSCWGLTVSLGQNDLKQKFVRFLLNIDFGSATKIALGG